MARKKRAWLFQAEFPLLAGLSVILALRRKKVAVPPPAYQGPKPLCTRVPWREFCERCGHEDDLFWPVLEDQRSIPVYAMPRPLSPWWKWIDEAETLVDFHKTVAIAGLPTEEVNGCQARMTSARQAHSSQSRWRQ